MLGSPCNSCCGSGCPACEGSTCCGAEYPRTVGVCCEGIWRMPGEGTCCGGVWYASGTSGVCCGGVWYSDEDSGDCCGDIWHPIPEGETAPDRSAVPFVPVSWEATECPEGSIYARWGQFGECCGCISGEVFDPRAGDPPGTGAMVPTESVLADLCCDGCAGPLRLPFNEYGDYVGCLGACCADGDCSRLPQWQCEAGVHPTNPEATYYSWTGGCCEQNLCTVECCVGGDVVQLATFAVTGVVAEGNEWTLTIGTATFTYTATADDATLDDIAAGLAAAVWGSFSATASGAAVVVKGPASGAGTITPPGGSPVAPTATQAAQIPAGECSAIGGSPRVDGNCPCQPGQTCCETAASSGTMLTFTKPAVFSGTVRVTVTGTTTGPILVYDTPFGQDATPTKRCPFTHTFLLCHGTFNISPLPCSGMFHRVDVEVCYKEESTSTETFNFSGCNGPIALGACPTECATTLVYTGAGLTSSAAISIYRDAVIEANGTGPLVLTSNITASGGCAQTLTLAGTSTAANEIAGAIQNSSAGLSVKKAGTGLWRLSAANSYSGNLNVTNGTLVVARFVGSTGASPFGTQIAIVGSTAEMSGTAALLVESGLSVGRAVVVAALGVGSSQVVVLGGLGTGVVFSGPITLNRSVTLQAATGGTVNLSTPWIANNASTTVVTIGSAGNSGTVELDTWNLPNLAGVIIANGTGRIVSVDDLIEPDTPVTVGSSLGPATLDINGLSQTLSNLTFAGTNGSIVGGTLRLTGSVTDTGTGSSITSAVSLDAATTFGGAGSLNVSGVVSGTGSLTKQGDGTLTLSGANTYSGTTTINGGTLKAGSLTAFGTGDIVVNAGGTLDKNGFALANTITNNGGTVIN